MAFVPEPRCQNASMGIRPNEVADRGRSSRGESRSPIRRRPTREQGRSLELLGHAIEYLVDSDLNGLAAIPSTEVSQAAQVLMRLSRQVFAECSEVVSLRRKLANRIHSVWERKTHSGAVAAATAPRS